MTVYLVNKPESTRFLELSRIVRLDLKNIAKFENIKIIDVTFATNVEMEVGRVSALPPSKSVTVLARMLRSDRSLQIKRWKRWKSTSRML